MEKGIYDKYYSWFTLFVTGSAIMVVELLGTRLLGPFYGVSLFIWSALITVALVSLAIGYRLGGTMADRALAREGDEAVVRKAAARKLYIYIMSAGIYIMLIPGIANSVLKLTSPLGIRMGALTSATILFAVPLVLLSMATPYMIKLLTRNLSEVGTSAGNLFAISTVGSFVGSIMTGFVLIPNFGTRSILYVQALILVTVWMAWEVVSKRYNYALIGVVIVVACIYGILGSGKLASADGFQVKHKTESFYGQLKVIDKDMKRWLAIDGMAHTGINRTTGLSLFPYTYYLEMPTFMRPDATNALVVGLGGGSVPIRLEQEYGLKVDSVEIDSKVVDIARHYFGFSAPDERVFIRDGRSHINNTNKKYDIVVLDAFSASDSPPFHLLTKEMFGTIKDKMSSEGILAINTVAFGQGKGIKLPASIYKTLNEVFTNVRAFQVFKKAEFGNVIYLASTGELELQRELEGCSIKGVCDLLKEMIAKERTYPDNKGIVLTDNYNPIEIWNIRTSERVRQNIYEYLPAEVLSL